MTWTEAQQNAIKARDCNLLVAAAAGSGKTAVLVERIIKLVLEDGVDIDRMLIVTFTQAAAGEMRERISNALQSELESNPENEQHLRRQLKLLNQASISTIHAFCTDVIRRYFHLVGIDPGFRISDSMESDLIKMETLEDFFEACYEKETDIFLQLVESFGSSRSDQSLQDLVLRAYEFAQCKPYPEQWLEDRAGDFNLGEQDFLKCPWISNIKEQITVQVQAAADLFQEALQLCYHPHGPAVYVDVLLDDTRIAEELLQVLDQGNIFDLYTSLSSVNHSRLPRVGQDVDSNLKNKAQKLRNEGKELIRQAGNEFLFKEPAQLLQDLNELYPLMKGFSQLIIDFGEEYQKRKADKNILDFNDLEHYALTILSNPEAANDYREKYQYIFVDEYQDSNEVQEALINCIKRNNNVFMVGDIKQSIYRFRLADPTLFIQKMEEFRGSDEKLKQRIDLSINFRSREEILNGANYIFTHIMSPYLGEITYDEQAALYPGFENSDAGEWPVDVYLIDKNRGDDDDELAQVGDTEIEAYLAAQKIKELLGQPIYDHKLKNYRPLEYRDMVVLMRSARNTITAFWDVFAAEGIPVYADLGSGYFESTEIILVINLLRLIDNRRQDIPLLSVMRSPIARFTLDELIEIRIQSQARSYYEAIEAYLIKHDNELKDKLQKFMEDLTRWKKEARYLPMDEFIWKLLQETGYYYYAGAMPGGRQRQANLKALLDRAHQFQEASIKGLFNFIKYIDKIQARSADMGVARILGENENLVRIMSIHRSKGLEFPVVILAGLGKQFNFSDSSSRILFHKDLGIGPRYVNPDLRSLNETIARVSIKNKIHLENLSEEMRILYVGCTRPRHKLIMIGSVRDVENSARKWSNAPTPFNLARGRNPLDWIGPVLMRHPDGTPLRGLTEEVTWNEEDLQNHPSRWQVEILKRSNIGSLNTKANEMLNSFHEQVKQYKASNDCELVSQRLSWQYQFEQAERIPSKVTVSQLQAEQAEPALMGMEMPALITRPRFVEGVQELTPAQKGSIMHFVMQHLDFTEVQDWRAIRKQVEMMVKQEMLLGDEAKTVNTTKISRFFRSPLGQRILNAPKVEREVPFNQLRPAVEIMDIATAPDEKLLVQGVIDLFFYEGDEIVLVDFKTDYITEDNREELISFYRPQLKLYKEALETIQGKKVKESHLYFFGIDEAVLVEI